ncbi:MAG: Wzz/FepE/Etk N-terminal domain-containing protein [bacterium]|nr:Wzz/FepE/Etk N-terminal domain-containing protein [bacterium]
MEYKNYFDSLSRNKRMIFIITAMFLIAASLFTFLQPLKYSAESRLLVVQNYGPNADAYNVSRSNQFLGNLLAQVVYSDSFYEKVMAAGYNISPAIFSADANKRKKQWRKTVYTKAVADTGMIVLKTYHQDKAAADQLNQAIAFTLMTKAGQYHGLGDKVQIKIIDNSTLSDLPVKPNVVLNLILALLSGLAASLYYIYLFSGKNFELKAPGQEVYDDRAPEKEPAAREEIYKPNLAFQPAQALYDEIGAEPANELDIEEAGEEDEFEPFFKGDINNVIRKLS